MNRLHLNRVLNKSGHHGIQFRIDGKPFEDIFNELRARKGEQPLEADSDYQLSYLNFFPVELLGDLADDVGDIELRSDLRNAVDDAKQYQHCFDGERFQVSLLTCSCGESECWGVWCALEIRARTVVWREFRSGIVPLDFEFEFEREQYVPEFVRFCTDDAPKSQGERERVLDAGFSHDGGYFIVLTTAQYHVWNLKDGRYSRGSTLRKVDYHWRGAVAFEEEEGIVLGGPEGPEGLWHAREYEDTRVRILSTRTEECLVELRLDPVNSRWLVLAMDGLFEFHGSLTYPAAVPTILGGYVCDRDPGNLRKGLLALTLNFAKHGNAGSSGDVLH